MHKNFAVKVKNGDLQAILRQKSQYMEKICVMFFQGCSYYTFVAPFVQYFLDRCDHTQNRIPFYCRTIIIEQIIIEQTVSSMYYYR